MRNTTYGQKHCADVTWVPGHWPKITAEAEIDDEGYLPGIHAKPRDHTDCIVCGSLESWESLSQYDVIRRTQSSLPCSQTSAMFNILSQINSVFNLLWYFSSNIIYNDIFQVALCSQYFRIMDILLWFMIGQRDAPFITTMFSGNICYYFGK